LKVCLLSGDLPVYQDLIDFPPEGVLYVGWRPHGLSSYYGSKASVHRTIRKAGWFLINEFKLPPMTYVLNQVELIHSTRGIIVLNRKPWVIDLDYVQYFFGRNIYGIGKTSNLLLYSGVCASLLSKYCKRIMCWSNAAKQSIVSVFGTRNEISKKISVVYPATRTLPIKKSHKGTNIRILHVSSIFNQKGGLEVLEAFQAIRKEYPNVELCMKCDVPPEVKKRYRSDHIEYLPYKSRLIPRGQLISDTYGAADIFVYPTHGDLFGLSLFDAMVAGLPIVATKTFAIPEIVQDGKTGFLVNPSRQWYKADYLPESPEAQRVAMSFDESIVNQLIEKISVLLGNAGLREEMGKAGRQMVETGKFSIEHRNQELGNIYNDSLVG
jgi:glycosyltransferase involved in cell wall biosynthesis